MSTMFSVRVPGGTNSGWWSRLGVSDRYYFDWLVGALDRFEAERGLLAALARERRAPDLWCLAETKLTPAVERLRDERFGDGEFLLITGIKIPYYGVPNQWIERRGVSHGIKLKHWRAVGHVFNTFAIESFVDQMAVDQGIDPIEFRFERMGATPKARKVFETLAQMSDYKAKRPEGRAIGISITAMNSAGNRSPGVTSCQACMGLSAKVSSSSTSTPAPGRAGP